ncbi:MAG: DUF192 domain-containing protein, partial [Gemmatimonadaceae bacterium]
PGPSSPTRRGMRVPFAVMLAFGIACADKSASDASDTAHIMSFDTTHVRLATRRDTTRISVELARSVPQKTMGLMERRTLAESAGMLFVYDSTQGKDAGFWMYRTRIPLDIAYIDSAGTIRVILAMVPCTTTLIEGCPGYPPNVPYRYALEMNAGFFARHQIGVGDAVIIGDVPAASTK